MSQNSSAICHTADSWSAQSIYFLASLVDALWAILLPRRLKLLPQIMNKILSYTERPWKNSMTGGEIHLLEIRRLWIYFCFWESLYLWSSLSSKSGAWQLSDSFRDSTLPPEMKGSHSQHTQVVCLVFIYNDFINALPSVQKVLSFWSAIQVPPTAPAIVVSKLCDFVPVLTPRCVPHPRLSLMHLLHPFCISSLKTYCSYTNQPRFVSSSSLQFLKLVLVFSYFCRLKAN